MKKILILCTGNSCRSQMAEGLLRHLGAGQCDVSSAGIRPSFVNPRAIQVMREMGIDISYHTSDSVEKYLDQDFDTVITVCDNAKEACPTFPKKTEMIHWSFDDPADASGSEDEILTVFRRVRDEIHRQLVAFFVGGIKR